MIFHRSPVTQSPGFDLKVGCFNPIEHANGDSAVVTGKNPTVTQPLPAWRQAELH
jgi:hypothetical protein